MTNSYLAEGGDGFLELSGLKGGGDKIFGINWEGGEIFVLQRF